MYTLLVNSNVSNKNKEQNRTFELFLYLKTRQTVRFRYVNVVGAVKLIVQCTNALRLAKCVSGYWKWFYCNKSLADLCHTLRLLSLSCRSTTTVSALGKSFYAYVCLQTTAVTAYSYTYYILNGECL